MLACKKSWNKFDTTNPDNTVDGFKTYRYLNICISKVTMPI